MNKNVTTFEITENESGILVEKKRNGFTIQGTYAINHEHAEQIRSEWVNKFWGFDNLSYN